VKSDIVAGRAGLVARRRPRGVLGAKPRPAWGSWTLPLTVWFRRCRFGQGGRTEVVWSALVPPNVAGNLDWRQVSAISFGAFQLFPAERMLRRGDHVVRLGGRAFDILATLADRPGELVSSRELMDKVWPDVFVGEASLRLPYRPIAQKRSTAAPTVVAMCQCARPGSVSGRTGGQAWRRKGGQIRTL